MKFKPLVYALSITSSFSAFAVEAPSGVRPCCAFGINMKSELGVVPVPFFRVDNIVEQSDLKQHLYNDGSQGVASSLIGTGEEANGLIYTAKGGILDTAHVRDTADYTYYLYNQIKGNLGQDKTIILTDELRSRVIHLTQRDLPLTQKERLDVEIKLSAILAFRLAQWHEIAQWFGFTSVAGFKEYPSAFSPEDLYSNMLGAIIGIEILQRTPALSKTDYQQAFSATFLAKLKQLDAQPRASTESIMNALDKKWWDSDKRLPNKWVVKTRDYTPRLTLTPHWGSSEGRIPLSLQDYKQFESYGYLTLVASKHEKSFTALPDSLLQHEVWTVQQFNEIAEFAKQQDDKHSLSNNQLLPNYSHSISN
ncbi:DUF4056 domain-containing protein [Vibrio gallicus]|uniref:DUF4056 domain-containing protein n=1 Tax=Vibrio gallicus TaxID=190897 RepID=UPI0021C46AAD|nr:DUF4056 domain-containing protein [Vibrio gallicus]